MQIRKVQILLSMLVCFISLVHAQNDAEEVPENELGMSPFSIENNTITLHRSLRPMFYVGLYYSRFITPTNWSIRSEVRYGENTINDDCKNCSDHLSGRGSLNDLMVSAGVRYSFLQQRKIFLQPYIQLGIHYNYLRYSGTFRGGISGTGTLVKDDKIHGIGGKASTGITFLLGQHFTVTVQSEFRISFGAIRTVYNADNNEVHGFNQPVGLKVGYRF